MIILARVASWLCVATLVVLLSLYSPSWPVVVVGCVGALLFVVAEFDEHLNHRP